MSINIYLCVLVTLAMTSTADNVICQNGALCLPLQDCHILNSSLKEVSSQGQGLQQIIRLLRRLHCGFDNDKAKICCPPEFKDINGLNLLPNTSVCGVQMTDRIYGGVETGLDEHPWTVLIIYKKPLGISFVCGGVLISSRYVLTSAHCFTDKNIKRFQVRLGEWNLASRTDCQQDDCSPEPLTVDVQTITLHENYNPNGDHHNDIALVRLVQDIPFTDFVRPICLPIEHTLRSNTFEAYDMETVGWGLKETGITSDIKLKVNLKVTNTEDCRTIYKFGNRTITEKQLCAGGMGGKDSCRGDSGGALMGQLGVTKNWMAVGIISFGPNPCGSEGWPGVYTRVTEYIDWILSKIQP